MECAHQLGKLCQNRHLLVNLIPYNQTDVKDKLRCPNEQHLRQFQETVTSYNVFCTVRRTMGADIASACGQLVVQKEKEDTSLVHDIEDTLLQKNNGSMKPKSENKLPRTQVSNIHIVEKHDADNVVEILAIATSIAAICFIVSTTLFLRQRK
jgi:hypothetical protein